MEGGVRARGSLLLGGHILIGPHTTVSMEC